ncbi:MAG: alpha amylase C-terminal domain-containing protein, partial [Ruminococcus sp.]|nr:alpha amylase C-terminal domain-containing protein [Ruminococcus sp.]
IRVDAVASMLYLDYNRPKGEWDPNELGGKENLEAVEFIKRMNTAIHMYHPDVMMIAEESTSWPLVSADVDKGGLGFDYKWNMGWMNDMLHYMSLDPLWRPFNHDSLTFSFFYAFSENFILPISHDEVVYGKHSLIDKMPGDPAQKLACVRTFIAYMIAHPGKKLLFMGSEIGQEREWDSNSELDWAILADENHRMLHDFYRDINRFYLENKPLYEVDFNWEGFNWIHHDDYTKSIIAFRRIAKNGEELIVLCNFQPTSHENYYIGVPEYGIYDEVFNSDDPRYGGSGVSNGKGIKTVDIAIHGYNQAIKIKIPPLSVSFIKLREKLERPVKEKVEKKKVAKKAHAKKIFKNPLKINK